MKFAVAEKEKPYLIDIEPGFITQEIDISLKKKKTPLISNIYPSEQNSQDGLDFSMPDYLGLNEHPRIMDTIIRTMISPEDSQLTEKRTSMACENDIGYWLHKSASLFMPSGRSAISNLLHVLSPLRKPIYIDDCADLNIRHAIKETGLNYHVYPRHTTDALMHLIDAHGPGIIMVDAVSLIDGSIAPLPDIADLSVHYDCLLIVDESHSLGIYGEGRSLCAHLEVSHKVYFTTAELNATFCHAVGLIAGTSRGIDYLRYKMKALNLLPPVHPHTIATLNATLNIIQKDDWRRAKLHTNVNYLRSRLARMGFNLSSDGSHIVNILIADKQQALAIHNALRLQHIFSKYKTYPHTPKEYSALHFIVHAKHDKLQLDLLADTVQDIIT